VLEVEQYDCDPESSFLYKSRNHRQPIPHRVFRYNEEENLPRHPRSYKAIIELRVSDRWRVVATRLRLSEILRDKDEQTINASDQIQPFGKSHNRALLSKRDQPAMLDHQAAILHDFYTGLSESGGHFVITNT
jgi:hypothetical protein